MRRPASIALVFLAGIGAALALAVAFLWGEAIARGERGERYPQLIPRLTRLHPERSLVVWLGDSTIEHAERRASALPRLVGRELTPAVETRIVALPGLDPFEHYCLMGPILELGPSLIVMTVNLTMFHRDDDELLRRFAEGLGVGRRHRSDKLAYMIPASELPRALTLPLEERGLTRSRLLLLQALAIPAVRDWVAFGDGLRGMFQDALDAGLGRLLPAHEEARGDLLQRYQELGPRFEAEMVRQYYRDIPASHPLLESLGAAVSMATRRGVPVLAYVTPIPRGHLPELGWYDPEAFAARTARIRSVVEAHGGSLIDLHAALPEESFYDLLGHYDRAGGESLARRLRPLIASYLEGQVGSARPGGRVGSS